MTQQIKSVGSPRPQSNRATPGSNSNSNSNPNLHPRYALHKGLGFWELYFKGERGFFKHEQGAYYVAHLLLNPPERPIHGLALTIAVAAVRGRPIPPLRITDSVTGHTVLLDGDGTLQQRSMGFEAFDAAYALRKTQLALEAILDDESSIEPVKAEALRDLEAIYNFQKTTQGRIKDAAQRAVHAVSMAIKRFHHRLSLASDVSGCPHSVLRPFARHIEKYILLPSGRYLGSGRARSLTGAAGCFTYARPRGVVWEG
jgi:hypothetical protein